VASQLVCVIEHITIAARPGLTLEKAVFAAIAPEAPIAIDRREHDAYAWVGLDAVDARLVWDSHRTTWAAVSGMIGALVDPPPQA